MRQTRDDRHRDEKKRDGKHRCQQMLADDGDEHLGDELRLDDAHADGGTNTARTQEPLTKLPLVTLTQRRLTDQLILAPTLTTEPLKLPPDDEWSNDCCARCVTAPVVNRHEWVLRLLPDWMCICAHLTVLDEHIYTYSLAARPDLWCATTKDVRQPARSQNTIFGPLAKWQLTSGTAAGVTALLCSAGAPAARW